jgi:transposase-like protein
MVYLWRAVDHEGEILESYVTKKRDKAAALAFMKKALKRHGQPATVVTDGLRSYPAAMRELGNLERQEMGCWKNNGALEEQSGGEQSPTLPTARARNAQIPANEDPAKICRSSFLNS